MHKTPVQKILECDMSIYNLSSRILNALQLWFKRLSTRKQYKTKEKLLVIFVVFFCVFERLYYVRHTPNYYL